MNPSELDTQRASLCCLAINQDSAEKVQGLFKKYRDLNFIKVVIPPLKVKEKKNTPNKLLFATALDENGKSVVYVAFGGSPLLADILRGSQYGNLTIWDRREQDPRNERSGEFHEIFYDRLHSSVPSVNSILQFSEHLTIESSSPSPVASRLFTSAYRVVFCGHGLGGAISHMAMLTYLLSLSSLSSKDSILRDILQDTQNLISISFGAPLFCEEKTSTNLNSKFGTLLEKHFFNYYSELDPVPFLLIRFGLPATQGEKQKYVKVREKFSTVLNEVGSILNSPEAADIDNDSCLRDSLDRLPKRALKHLDLLYAEVDSIKCTNHYGLFGSYLGVTGTMSPTSENSMTSSHSAFKQSRAPTFRRANLEAHAMISYFKALSDGPDHSRDQSSVSVAALVIGDPPEVTDAFMVILRGETRRMNTARIEATGRNLSLLLEKKCSISTLREDRWAVISGDDETICWESTSALTDDERSELQRAGDGPATNIRVETTFGRTKGFTAVYMRNTTSGSFAVEGLMHALGKMVILHDTVGPQSCLPSLEDSANKIRDQVDTAASLARIPERWIDNMHWILRSQTYSVQEKKSILDQGIFRKICEELCETPLVVGFDDSHEPSLVFLNIDLKETVDYLMGICEMLLTFVDPIAVGFAMLVALGVKGILLLVEFMLRSKSIELRTYEEIIKFLYNQIFHQSNKGEQNQEEVDQQPASNFKYLHHGGISIRACEQAIYEYVEKNGYENIKFNDKLSLATQEKMEARIRLVHAMQTTYHTAKREKLLGVVGVENAGKSTLINLLKRHETSSSLREDVAEAEIGYCVHTEQVQGFYIEENIVAVDFPGVGGACETRSNAWKTFEKAPDLCIIMVKFTGDVDTTCQNLRSTFADKLSTQFILLVNQVDCIMKGRAGSLVWKEYSPQAVERLREKYRLGTGGRVDTVYMCCLEDEDLEDFDREQLKQRGILFGEEVAHKILEQIHVDNPADTFQN